MQQSIQQKAHTFLQRTFLFAVATILVSCSSTPPPLSDGHLTPKPVASQKSIPKPLAWSRTLPEPKAQTRDETYTVVVSGVPADELLFALAREAGLNIDIHPGIEGNITINAIDQTLPQILDRLSSQISLRYSIKGKNLEITPDTPYFNNYKVDYANISRDTTHTVSLSTQIASTGAGIGEETTLGNNSTTAVNSISFHHFWQSLVMSVIAILGDEDSLASAAGSGGASTTLPITANVIPNPESGLLTVQATQAQHREIRKLIDRVQESSDRQVLIEATVVEITLSQEFRAGVDWQRIVTGDGGGLGFEQSLIGNNFSALPFFTATYVNSDSVLGNIAATVTLLEEFGDVKILSSPKIMALNNQNAVLKVVDNIVYFTIEIDDERNENGIVIGRTFESDVHTVPVGFVMTVTPQISEGGKITMNVRPTVSRILEYVNDPAVDIASANAIASTPQGGTAPEPVESKIPVIQVREFESMLRINSGQTAVLGGLMQDSQDQGSEGLPGASRLGKLGNLFKYQEDEFSKSELVVFLRPTVIDNPSIEGDLSAFKPFLTSATFKPLPESTTQETAPEEETRAEDSTQ